MKVREAMSRRVVSVSPDASILQAGELMLQHHISGLPVVDAEGHVVGIVTERDFLRPAGIVEGTPRPRWLEVLTGRSQFPHAPERSGERRIADVMTRSLVTTTEDALLEEVVGLMEERRIKRIPVVRDGRLVGIISRADLLRALVRSLRNRLPNDEVFRQRLTDLERQSWLHRTRFDR
jgi:CBS domain-containing protein